MKMTLKKRIASTLAVGTIAMSISGELSQPEKRTLFDGLRGFEHRSGVILQTHLIDYNPTFNDARAQLGQLSP